MARLLTLPSQAIIDGFKCKVDFYVHRGIPCARTWPRSPGQARTPAVEAQWPVFSTVAKLWPQLSVPVKEAYEEMTLGTNLTGKDMLVRGYISGTLRFYIPVDELE
ncbi:hypothetical protein ES703_40745 [subsurface metagenome]